MKSPYGLRPSINSCVHKILTIKSVKAGYNIDGILKIKKVPPEGPDINPYCKSKVRIMSKIDIPYIQYLICKKFF